jgi:hypothetical protein
MMNRTRRWTSLSGGAFALAIWCGPSACSSGDEMDLPPWKSAGSAVLGSSGLVTRGDWAARVFTRLGAPPPPGSRLRQALSLIRGINDDPTRLEDADDGLLRRISNAHQTIWNLFVVAYGADQRTRAQQPWFPSALLREALGGAEDPSSDLHRKARNAEFELYVATLLGISGASVGFAEPDLEVLVPSRRVGIAVKRMSSLTDSKLAARLAEAADQIGRAHGVGYVAVNIDAYFRGEALDASEEKRAVQFGARLEKVLAAVRQSLGQRRAVKGVLAFGYMESWDTSARPPRHSSAHPTSFQLIEDDGEAREDLTRIREFWDRILRNMQSEIHHLVIGKRE